MNHLYPWQTEIWQHLCGLRSRLPHALLLRGPKGIGKFDLALGLAQAVLCATPQADGQACGTCSSCHWFGQGSHPDFRLIQPDALAGNDDVEEKDSGKKASREISIDQIRALSDFANLSTHCGGYRVVVIHPAEALNNNAANALLKTLEEPSSNLLFILVTHKPQQLLPTILSRCLSISIPTPSRELALEWLQQQGMQNPELILCQAGFAPLEAMTLTGDAVAESNQLLLGALKQSNKFDALSLADQLQRVAPAQIIHLLQQWCHDLASSKLAKKVRYFSEHAETIGKISGAIQLDELMQYQKELLAARRHAAHPLNPKLLFESLFLNYAHLVRPSPAGKR